MNGTNMSFGRTLVDEWVRAGLTDAVISPGSRSTPLAIAVAEQLRTHVILDERSAAFTALGLALASGRPTVLVCTSGTAAAEYHAAVIEASQAWVPLIVCTADRPPELQDIGAPQTTDQVGLYGTAVRWSHDPGPPDPAAAHTWRSLAARAVWEATGAAPGPVHLNLPFREPLLDDLGANPAPGRHGAEPWLRPAANAIPSAPEATITELCATTTRPLVVTGYRGSDLIRAETTPILGDHRGPVPGNVAHWDLLLRDPVFAEDHRPDLIIRNGMPAASRTLLRWLADLDVPQIVVTPDARWIDPVHRATFLIDTRTALELTSDPVWTDLWHHAADTAASAIDQVLASETTVTEPAVARDLFATRPPGSTLVVSSSMPIRDLETFATPRHDVTVLANRGANGIDGVTSTAVGVALTGAPTTLLTGDLALLHDTGALTGIMGRSVDLTIVVVDNAGGGIFSFLPQHEMLDHDRFEQLFGTPQDVDLPALLAAHGIPTETVTTRAGLHDGLARVGERPGVRALHVRTDRAANRVVHDRLAAAVQAVIG